MIRVLLLTCLLVFSVSGKAGELVLFTKNHAWTYHLHCLGASCSQVQLTVRWNTEIGKTQPVSLTEFRDAIVQAKFSKQYLSAQLWQDAKKTYSRDGLPGVLLYDPAAGGLNLLLPVVWAVGLVFLPPTVAALDSLEGARDQNSKMQRILLPVLDQLEEVSRSRTDRNIELKGLQTGARLEELVCRMKIVRPDLCGR